MRDCIWAQALLLEKLQHRNRVKLYTICFGIQYQIFPGISDDFLVAREHSHARWVATCSGCSTAQAHTLLSCLSSVVDLKTWIYVPLLQAFWAFRVTFTRTANVELQCLVFAYKSWQDFNPRFSALTPGIQEVFSFAFSCLGYCSW